MISLLIIECWLACMFRYNTLGCYSSFHGNFDVQCKFCQSWYFISLPLQSLHSFLISIKG